MWTSSFIPESYNDTFKGTKYLWKKKIAELKIMNDLSKLCHKRLWSITFKSHAFEFFFSGQ